MGILGPFDLFVKPLILHIKKGIILKIVSINRSIKEFAKYGHNK